MGIHLYRIDDRLIHGQVVVGWGQPLNARFLILVDDLVASSDWEKELYRMAVPPEMDIYFADVATAVRDHARYAADPRPGGGRRHRGQQRPRLEDGPIVAAAERGEVVHAPAMIEARLVRDPPHRPVGRALGRQE